MPVEIDVYALEQLRSCFPQQPLMSETVEVLEASIHEMAHVVAVLGTVVHPPPLDAVDTVVSSLQTVRAMDINEVRAAVVTRTVLRNLGLLTQSLDRYIIDAIGDALHGGITHTESDRLFKQMTNSRRTLRMAKKIEHVLRMWGVVRAASE